MQPDELPALRATWERIRPPFGAAMSFEQAIAWPPMRAVLRGACRAFDPARQNIEHPTVRAMANVYSLPAQRTRDHRPPPRKRKAPAAATPPATKHRAPAAQSLELFDPLEVT